MVKKLFKHEMLSYLRLWLPMQAVLLAIAFFMRILLFFESDNTAYKISFGSSYFLYIVAIMASVAVTLVFAIIRFYKNLFTHEGYLTFTLPVSPMAHIFVKVATAVLFTVFSLLSVVISIMVVTSGELLIEIFKAIGYIVKQAFTHADGLHLVLYLLEMIALFLVSLAGSLLFYYTCIAIGQMAKKNRKIAAFGAYFGFYVISQIISTVFVILFATNPDLWANMFEDIMSFAIDHPYAFIHLFFLVSTLISGAFSALYFFVTHLIIRKKLNLE